MPGCSRSPSPARMRPSCNFHFSFYRHKKVRPEHDRGGPFSIHFFLLRIIRTVAAVSDSPVSTSAQAMIKYQK